MSATRAYRDGHLVAEGFDPQDVSDWLKQPDVVIWLDLPKPDHAALELVRAELGLDPFAIEDAQHRRQRPKVDRYRDHLFVSVYATRIEPESCELVSTEISAFVTLHALVTLHDDGLDRAALLERWDADPELIAAGGGGALLYGLLDLVVDGHFEVVQDLDDAIEEIEDVLFGEGAMPREMQRRNYTLRKSLVQLRRQALPMREAVNTLLRRDSPVLTRATDAHYQDLYDHVLRVSDWADGLREMVTTVFETNLSMQDHQLNSVMKKLTGWAAIIAVPTAVTGYFGQNVRYAGFGTTWGWWLSNGVIAGLAVGLFTLFQKKDWI